ncbi:class I SAM-dependent methyltransferase [Filibacter tadaridae]|uniref:WAC domain-containing protein n=1 Tax=Filibacter tadaridae TaxID=2483811 RepID=A0A3P5WJW5_9BACL|nr:class I SAM-dependent methyltransferase [Filibacter tadaridae]VDC21102.1 hypothetical protein FILTAD_00576 [Filibacter tadaridae]
MEYKGSAVYDDDEFLDNYLSRRCRAESPNNVIEKPVLMELIGEVRGKKVLDLGCGDAEFGVELLGQGCSFYEGVEGSLNMVRKAVNALDYTISKIHHSSMETWGFPEEVYDLVVSRLALHYVENIEPVFNQVYNSLKEDGQFVFSIQHPVLTSSVQSATKSARTDWKVDDYFHTGKRVEPWIEKDVVKYHRTIEEYFQGLKRAGFKIEEISECRPRRENFKNEEEYKRRMRIPLFLVFACKK